MEAGAILSVHSLVGTGCVGHPPPQLALLQHRSEKCQPPCPRRKCVPPGGHTEAWPPPQGGSWGWKGLPDLSLGVQQGGSCPAETESTNASPPFLQPACSCRNLLSAHVLSFSGTLSPLLSLLVGKTAGRHEEH